MSANAFPSADTVAALIVESCAETGEAPLDAADPRKAGILARAYVLSALWAAWPDISVARLSRVSGYSQPRNPSHLAAARAGRSWDAALEARLIESAEGLRAEQERRAA